jgi:hypothetical protein
MHLLTGPALDDLDLLKNVQSRYHRQTMSKLSPEDTDATAREDATGAA